jgi:AcrR family transcriptional regulator
MNDVKKVSTVGTGRVDGRTLRYQHRRPELLAAATEYVLDHGIGELSLRPIARALGVTHATLLRHFSSKDELLVQVVRAIYADFTALLDNDEELRAAHSVAELLTKLWRRLCEPRQQRQFLLLFELVAREAREPEWEAGLRRSIISDWLPPIEDRLIRDGWPAGDATALATQLLAQIRGLQLDLLISGDRARVDRSIELTADMLTTRTTSVSTTLSAVDGGPA